MKHPQPIGELNGFWSMLFRASLCAFPVFAGIVMAWSTWVTKEIFAHDRRISEHQKEYSEIATRAAETRNDVRDVARRLSAVEQKTRTTRIQ